MFQLADTKDVVGTLSVHILNISFIKIRFSISLLINQVASYA
jgi:hypothetical protein